MFKHVKNFTVIALSIILLSSFLVIASSYFNSKQIGSLSMQCIENNGIIHLEIHNSLTNDYSFECKKNEIK
ncbi:hypothetical protein B0H99_10318 [Planomicrobium soli]|uniref:Uncharacterized protein n=1 Tax=Planomicrobium soli TaxID=1176648 RepID=A0A2P8H3U2_9BACL|nr:hypothetical protein B0H99_10318 [Planomicrobium soli]